MRERRDADSTATTRSDFVVRALTLLMLGGLVWLATGGAITKVVERNLADLDRHVRGPYFFGLWSLREADFGATYAAISRNIVERETGYFPEEERAEELAQIAAIRRYGHVGFGIICLGGLLLSWNLVRPRARPARLLLVHGFGLATLATACMTFHLGLRTVFPPIPRDSIFLALPAIIALSAGALSLLLLVAWARRGPGGTPRVPSTQEAP